MKKIITTTLVSLTIAAAAAIPAFAVEKFFADDTIVISGEITNGDEGSIMMVFLPIVMSTKAKPLLWTVLTEVSASV